MSFTKYLKNNTNSGITVSGIYIPPNSYYLVQAEEDIKVGADPEILVKIASGDIVTSRDNSGSSDISNVNESIDFLKNNYSEVLVKTRATANSILIPLSDSSVTLNRANQSYTHIYTLSDSGFLHGFCLKFNSDRVVFKVTVDSVVIMEFDLKSLKSIINDECGWFSVSDNAVSFHPDSPVEFDSELKVEARANSNSNGRKLNAYMLEIIKK